MLAINHLSSVRAATPARAQAAPFLKWVGGKTRLWQQLVELLPPDIDELRLVEPFVGGAAVFFHLAPRNALLADINPQLVATFRCVQTAVEPLIERLVALERAHNSYQYYVERARYNTSSVSEDPAQCARFIYLNKTCFNGLHRVNRSGEFNVPVGSYRSPRVADAYGLRAAQRALQAVELRTGHFSRVLEDARRGDFVYLDSPYDVEPGARNFTAYATCPFGPAQQDQQADVFRALDRRGCKLMLSNSDTRANRTRYAGYEISEVIAPRSISCDGARRRAVVELIVRNYV